MTEAYEAALNRSRAAHAVFQRITADYRARKIGDAEYLAGRAAHDAARKLFDAAYEIAQNEPEVTEEIAEEDNQLSLFP
jgi:hypothetical protein